jgi:hypothetical protein
MSSSVAPFVVDANHKGPNTRIDYHFASGRTVVKGSVVIQGNFTEEDIQSLRENLVDGAMFDPQRLGLPDLISKMPASWDGEEYLHAIDRVSATESEYDEYAPGADHLVALLDSVPQSWNTETIDSNARI